MQFTSLNPLSPNLAVWPQEHAASVHAALHEGIAHSELVEPR